MTREPGADDRARVALTEDERDLLDFAIFEGAPLTQDEAMALLASIVRTVNVILAQRAAADPRVEAIRALADELRAHAAAERPEDDRWDDGWRAAHRKIDARLRAALGDQP